MANHRIPEMQLEKLSEMFSRRTPAEQRSNNRKHINYTDRYGVDRMSGTIYAVGYPHQAVKRRLILKYHNREVGIDVSCKNDDRSTDNRRLFKTVVYIEDPKRQTWDNVIRYCTIVAKDYLVNGVASQVMVEIDEIKYEQQLNMYDVQPVQWKRN